MNLTEYIQADHGNGKRLADALGIPATFLSQMARGDRSVSPTRCVRIEVLTGGKVTRKDLRTDWKEIWPELADLQSEGVTHA